MGAYIWNLVGRNKGDSERDREVERVRVRRVCDGERGLREKDTGGGEKRNVKNVTLRRKRGKK
jgi:hypothetical protein